MVSLTAERRLRETLAAQCEESAGSFCSFLKKSIEQEDPASAESQIESGFEKVFEASLRGGKKENEELDKPFINVIVGKRSLDSIRKSYTVDEDNEVREFLLHADDANVSFSFDTLERQLGHPLHSLVKDLLDIGVAVYMSDRYTRRGRDLGRRIGLLMPVRHLDIWEGAKRKLERAVSFLGRDDFNIHFEKREEEAGSINRVDSFAIESDKRCVCLFSGGLDSMAGAVWALEKKLTPVFVSHYANNQLARSQRSLVSQLDEKYDRKLVSVEITQQSLEKLESEGVSGDLLTMLQNAKYHVGADELPRILERMIGDEQAESILEHTRVLEHIGVYATKARGKKMSKPPRSLMTQHLRSFLFLSLATAVALESGISTVYIFENGPVALNPLFSEARVNSRTAHPHFLAYFQALIRAIFKVELSIKNPFVYRTKGEVARDLAKPELGGLVAKTCSCWNWFRVPLMAKQRIRKAAKAEARKKAEAAGKTVADILIDVGDKTVVQAATEAAARAAATAAVKAASRAEAQAAAQAAAAAAVRAAAESKIKPTVKITGKAAADAAAREAAAKAVDGPEVKKAIEVIAQAAAEAAAEVTAKAAVKAAGKCRHDGECLPCVLRRTAMHHADLWDKDAPYLTNIFQKYPELGDYTKLAVADFVRFCKNVTSLFGAELLLRVPELSVYEEGVDTQKLVRMYRKHAEEVIDCFRERSKDKFQQDFASVLKGYEGFDLEPFQVEVLGALEYLKYLDWEEEEEEEWEEEEEEEEEKEERRRKREEEEVEAAVQAEKLVSQKDIGQYLCPALQTVADDAFDIAKVVTPILVPMVLAGTISIPLNPLFFATIALVIARMGVASLCAGYPKRNEDKK
jgi:7-cyano-7-deazaguanine synthase in queuosine biosynthesis